MKAPGRRVLGAVLAGALFAPVAAAGQESSGGAQVFLPDPIPCRQTQGAGTCPYVVWVHRWNTALQHDPPEYTEGTCLWWLPDYFGAPDDVLYWLPPSELVATQAAWFQAPRVPSMWGMPVVPSEASGVGWWPRSDPGSVCGWAGAPSGPASPTPFWLVLIAVAAAATLVAGWLTDPDNEPEGDADAEAPE